MQTQLDKPIRKVIHYEGAEQKYFIRLPKGFDPNKTYWPLVAAHGGGGDGLTFWMCDRLQSIAEEQSLKAIVISPSFDKSDAPAEAHPLLGGISFLNHVLQDVHQNYNLHPRILLTGYSRGGQFAHRYALYNPDSVEACAPFCPGSWTTPDGRIIISPLGEIKDPKSFLTSPQNATNVTKSVQYIFDPRIANIVGTLAKPDAKRIPFLIMCGSLDERFESAQKFADNLKSTGYHVETEWPTTAHGGRQDEASRSEFDKYPRSAIRFFLKITNKNRAHG